MFEGFGQIENIKSQNDINYSHDYRIIKIKTVFLFFSTIWLKHDNREPNSAKSNVMSIFFKSMITKLERIKFEGPKFGRRDWKNL